MRDVPWRQCVEEQVPVGILCVILCGLETLFWLDSEEHSTRNLTS